MAPSMPPVGAGACDTQGSEAVNRPRPPTTRILIRHAVRRLRGSAGEEPHRRWVTAYADRG